LAYPTPMEIPSSKSTVLRGRKNVLPLAIASDKVKPRRHFTRAKTKQNVPVKDDVVETSSQRKGKSESFEKPIEIVDITTPQEESNPTSKRLKIQLKEAMVEVDKLKSEDYGYRNNLKGIMGMYHETIDKARFLAKSFFPLHRQLKNLYRQNISHQAHIRKLKA
jgi:hypothetical protein